jgi:hypothetical protein
MAVPPSPSAGGSSTAQAPHSFVDSNFEVAPDVFHGDQTKWSKWSYIFTSYVHGISLKMGTCMDRCAGHPTLIPTSDGSNDVKEMANQLMTMLTTLCRDKALRVIKKLSSGEHRNGFEAWRLLCMEYNYAGIGRRIAILKAILHFNFAGDYLDKFNTWTDIVQQYARLGITDELAESVKLAIVLEQAPKQLRDHLKVNANVINGFSQVVEAIYASFSSKKAHVVGGLTPEKHTAGGPTPMDVDALGKGKAKGKKGEKGDKGKGKDDHKRSYKGKDCKGGYKGYKGDQSSYQGAGKGKGGKPEHFQGNCNFCGYWGHRADACRQNPQNGASWKPVHQLGAEEENYHPQQASSSSKPGTSARPIRALVQTGMPAERTGSKMDLNVAALKATSDSKRAQVMIDSFLAITGCPSQLRQPRCT